MPITLLMAIKHKFDRIYPELTFTADVDTRNVAIAVFGLATAHWFIAVGADHLKFLSAYQVKVFFLLYLL